MSDTPLSRIQAVALQLPGAAEARDADRAGFAVEGEFFARITDAATLEVRGENGWRTLSLDGDVDWAMVEDAIARGWELTAPAALLEAGGR